MMSKEQVLKEIFNLSSQDILDILDILNGYKERINKSKKDTTLARCMFAKGYHSTKEFMNSLNITKDDSLSKALTNEISSLKTLSKLVRIFNIDDETIIKIVKEINGSDSQ